MESKDKINSVSICVDSCKKRCGYHRRGQEQYREGAFSIPGMDLEVFYWLYPYLLSVLYDGQLKGDPYPEEFVIRGGIFGDTPSGYSVGFQYKKTRRVLNLLERLLRRIGLPKDAIDKIILIRGQMAAAGTVYRLTVPADNQLCPASFFSFYPLYFLLNHGLLISWSKDTPGVMRFSCPDPRTDICYTVGFPAQAKIRTISDYLPDFSGLALSQLNDCSCCLRTWPKQATSLARLLPENLCPFIFNIALPYLLTLQGGGYFKWRKDIDTVVAQCPGTQGKVSFELKAGRERGALMPVALSITGAQGRCPQNHFPGQCFSIDFSSTLCPHLFIRIFPWALLMAHSRERGAFREGISLSCPFEHKSAQYCLSYHRE